jgi:hypothetical protein
MTSKTYTLVNPRAVFRVPKDVETCPICGAQILLEFDEFEQDADGQWMPTACGLHPNCETEPEIGGHFWEDWFSGHWSMPYVDWLPVESRLLKWFNAHYRLDFTTPVAVHEIVAQPPVSEQLARSIEILPDNPLTPDSVTLARLLRWANSNPEGWWKKPFYALKDRILHTYAERRGFDTQHIVKPCWGCNGSGFVEDYRTEDDWDGHECDRCNGSGVFDEYHVLLQRWELGGVLFHIPDRRLTKTEAQEYLQDKSICENHFDGYLVHSNVPPSQRRLALLTLAYLFDADLYKLVLEEIARDNAMPRILGYGPRDADCTYFVPLVPRAGKEII